MNSMKEKNVFFFLFFFLFFLFVFFFEGACCGCEGENYSLVVQ